MCDICLYLKYGLRGIVILLTLIFYIWLSRTLISAYREGERVSILISFLLAYIIVPFVVIVGVVCI
jgi:hypothetical protein